MFAFWLPLFFIFKFSFLKKSSLNMGKIIDWANLKKKKKSSHLMQVHEPWQNFCWNSLSFRLIWNWNQVSLRFYYECFTKSFTNKTWFMQQVILDLHLLLILLQNFSVLISDFFMLYAVIFRLNSYFNIYY